MTVNRGSAYRVIGYRPSVNSAWRQKLLTMGILPGVTLEVVRVAPLGDPVQIHTHRVSLAVRQRDLADIILQEVVR